MKKQGLDSRREVKPHEVKMFVKREMGMYIYTFEAPTGVIQWNLFQRDKEEAKDWYKWTAECGGEQLGTCEGNTKESAVLEMVARTMSAFGRGYIPDHDAAILERKTQIDLLRYLTRNMRKYQQLCQIYAK